MVRDWCYVRPNWSRRGLVDGAEFWPAAWFWAWLGARLPGSWAPSLPPGWFWKLPNEFAP